MTVILAIIVMIPVLLWEAYAASILWGWFIVPVFPSVPMLGAWQMFGVLLVINSLRMKINAYKETRPVHWTSLLISLCGPAVLVGVGAVVKFYPAVQAMLATVNSP